MKLTHALPFVLALWFVAACAGSEPPPKAAAKQGDDESRGEGRPGLDVSSEIGALDEGKVTETFTRSVKDFQACLDAGAKRIEFIGGSVAFFVKIDSHGRVSHAHLEQSTLGDRETEKCMLAALAKREWPAPVGGLTGLTRKSFDFNPPNDVRPPTDWDSERATTALQDKSSQIAECKRGASGTYSATMYVNTNGSVLSVGVTPPDEKGESVVDCLVDLVKTPEVPLARQLAREGQLQPLSRRWSTARNDSSRSICTSSRVSTRTTRGTRMGTSGTRFSSVSSNLVSWLRSSTRCVPTRAFEQCPLPAAVTRKTSSKWTSSS